MAQNWHNFLVTFIRTFTEAKLLYNAIFVCLSVTFVVCIQLSFYTIYFFIPPIKVTGYVSVCVFVFVYQRISLTAEPIWFSFTRCFSRVIGRFITILGEGTTTLQREITPPQVPLEASWGIMASPYDKVIGFLCVPKDLAICWTNIFLLNRVALGRSQEGL